MLPAFTRLAGAEMIRDGGSLAAFFAGADGCEYWLRFKIRARHLSPDEAERLGYEAPVIVDRLTGRSIPVSWQHAAILLHQARGMATEQNQLKWLNIMDQVASTLGDLPPELDRVLRRLDLRKPAS